MGQNYGQIEKDCNRAFGEGFSFPEARSVNRTATCLDQCLLRGSLSACGRADGGCKLRPPRIGEQGHRSHFVACTACLRTPLVQHKCYQPISRGSGCNFLPSRGMRVLRFCSDVVCMSICSIEHECTAEDYTFYSHSKYSVVGLSLARLCLSLIATYAVRRTTHCKPYDPG